MCVRACVRACVHTCVCACVRVCVLVQLGVGVDVCVCVGIVISKGLIGLCDFSVYILCLNGFSDSTVRAGMSRDGKCAEGTL